MSEKDRKINGCVVSPVSGGYSTDSFLSMSGDISELGAEREPTDLTHACVPAGGGDSWASTVRKTRPSSYRKENAMELDFRCGRAG